MHFAVGMMGGGALAGAACLMLRRGWRWLPAAMTLGGLWALVPDMPRIWREDFPSLPLASVLGDKDLERWLHSVGDIFFFHERLDVQPRELALHGLVLMIALYNGAWLISLIRERYGRYGHARRTWETHARHRNQARSCDSSVRNAVP